MRSEIGGIFMLLLDGCEDIFSSSLVGDVAMISVGRQSSCTAENWCD